MRIWGDLHAHRSTGMGLSRFTWADLHAYCAVTQEVLCRHDLHIIRLIEAEFFASHHDADERRNKPARAPDAKPNPARNRR